MFAFDVEVPCELLDDDEVPSELLGGVDVPFCANAGADMPRARLSTADAMINFVMGVSSTVRLRAWLAR